MKNGHGHYIHGTAPTERRRLSRLNDLMNHSSLAAMKLAGGEKILDVGSGLAQLSLAMARAAGARGSVVGVERDLTQLAEAKANIARARFTRRVELRHGDAFDLPLRDDEWGTFDVVHTRFLLEHVPDPQAVVNGMVRAARVGGRIILEDDDHDVLRLYPEPRGAYAVWNAYIETYHQLKNDPYVGRRLVTLLHAAGARPVANRWNFFGSCAGEATFDTFVENFLGVLAGARETMLELTPLRPAAFDDAVAAIEAWGRLPDAALWYCTFWAEGSKTGS
jgi:ubiquinone/menaquinone biosynthesis C-methylase UbiE